MIKLEPRLRRSLKEKEKIPKEKKKKAKQKDGREENEKGNKIIKHNGVMA
ncbi:hypothetical protein PP707_01200 [Acetobacter pasteurianus]|nr:hypothetical protein [Acetobacter pasteurianus]